jgi:hypothetical protein
VIPSTVVSSVGHLRKGDPVTVTLECPSTLLIREVASTLTNAKTGVTVTNCVPTQKAVTNAPVLLDTPSFLPNTAKQTTVSTSQFNVYTNIIMTRKL